MRVGSLSLRSCVMCGVARWTTRERESGSPGCCVTGTYDVHNTGSLSLKGPLVWIGLCFLRFEETVLSWMWLCCLSCFSLRGWLCGGDEILKRGWISRFVGSFQCTKFQFQGAKRKIIHGLLPTGHRGGGR
eukprot:TRINITY_DN8723_c1_g2_i1.p1 TRINITY_DN8723_c1_g2~~TRINITY_DN8723_c1_g2_i1.p1  ORF type:complete len:131 (+),score=1.27 TRINITY_DN8723_c1_g2_i1:424-816(+)